MRSERWIKKENVLPAGTPIGPNIPPSLPLLLSQLLNLFTRQALIIAVIPLSDILRDLHLRFTSYRIGGRKRVGVIVVPGQFVSAANIQQFECTAGAVPGGDVAI